MKRSLVLGGALLAAAAAAELPAPAEFAWRATLDTNGQAGLVRVALPGDALAHLQSSDAADLRVFDAHGSAVPFALSTPRAAALPGDRTTQLRALPLHASASTSASARAVEVRIAQENGARSVWVQFGAAAAPLRSPRLPATLFDTRSLQEEIAAFVVQGRWPPNTPLAFTLSISRDLATWTPLPTEGRVYWFEGQGAPANDALVLRRPQRLTGHYLRLDWREQDNVSVHALVGVAATRMVPAHPSAPLPEPVADGEAALEWTLPFATPIVQLALATNRLGTVAPLRILGRERASDPWRLLGHSVLYRLDDGGGVPAASGPVTLAASSVRWLRVEALHSTRLADVPLTAHAFFAPTEVVFVARTSGRYELTAGRAATPRAALPLSILAATTAASLDALPAAHIVFTRTHAPAPPPAWARWLPPGTDPRAVGLWLVLAVAVLVLGVVAIALLRQTQYAKAQGAADPLRGDPAG